MDINGILAALGGIMAAWGISEGLGRGFLAFLEFWLVLLQYTIDGIRTVIERLRGLRGAG